MKGIGDVRSSSTIGKRGSSRRRQKTIQSATGFTIMATHSKGFALMTEDLQPRITVDSIINLKRVSDHDCWGEKPASTINWGAKPAFMIGWDAKSMKSQTIGWKRWLIL
jgi:hypothetical protein